MRKVKGNIRKMLAAIVLTLLCCSAFAQRIVESGDLRTTTDEQHGTVVHYLKGGKRPLSGKFRILRGQDEEIVHFSKGVMQGEYRRFRNGSLREKGKYTDGRRHGLFVSYHQDGKTPQREAPMQYGKIDGTVRTWFSDEKAYVTQLWDNRIFIINPKKYEITGYIQVPDMTMESGSTEQMVQYGKYVYCNCWSYQNRIIKIDTETDQVVEELKVGIQPTSLVMDKNHKMWTITDGGYEGSPYGYEAPSLYRIDAETFTVEKQFKFKMGDWPSEVQLNGTGDKLYWINKDIWSMDVDAERVPVRPFLEYSGTIYYGLTVDPVRGDVYVADAIDYQQQGIVYRYSSEGELIDEFYVGIIPGAFCWK